MFQPTDFIHPKRQRIKPRINQISSSNSLFDSNFLSLTPRISDSISIPSQSHISNHSLPQQLFSLNPNVSFDSCSSQIPVQPPDAPKGRKPQKGRELLNNKFRPHVLAARRLDSWSSPYAVTRKLELSSSLPAPIIANADKAMLAGIAPPTKSTYGAGLLRFAQFCDKFNIAEDSRIPASEVLIAGFIGHYMGSISGKTVKGWLSALRLWHDIQGAAWPAESRQIRLARRGANVEGAHHKRPRRYPVTIEHLRVLHSHLNFSNGFHCAIWACALTAFWGTRRLGELTIPSIAKFNPRFHVTRLSFIHFKDYISNSIHIRSAHFHIPWTKTTKQEGADVTVSAHPEFDGVAALRLHLTINNDVPDSFPLFSFIDRDGKPQHMLKSIFMDFVTKIWEEASLHRVHGHSFRIGGVVALLLAGVDPNVIAANGGWGSLAFLLYWRRLEDVIPMHIAKAYEKDNNTSLNEDLRKVKSILVKFQKQHKISNSMVDACIAGSDLLDSLSLDD